jgi:hypothetical protein
MFVQTEFRTSLCLNRPRSHPVKRSQHSNAKRWTSRHPLGYQDGMNMYRAMADNPVNRTDASGLKSEADDLTIGWTLHWDWHTRGFDFASALLTSFLQKSYPAADAGMTFIRFAPEIKAHAGTKGALAKYVGGLYLDNRNVENLAVPDNNPRGKPAFEYDFGGISVGFNIGDDLSFALGNAHFGHRNLMITRLGGCKWRAQGTIIQDDSYHWKNNPIFKATNASYAAMIELEGTYKYPAFYHREEFDVNMEGTSQGNGRGAVYTTITSYK